MSLESLTFSEVGLFNEVELEFDPKVNVFSGSNDAGKSTILKVLGTIAAYPYSMPVNLLRSDNAKWRLQYTALSGKARSASTKILQEHPDIGEILAELGYSCYIPDQRINTTFRSSGPTITKKDNTNYISIKHPEQIKRDSLLNTKKSIITDEDVIQKIIDLDYRGYLTKRNRMHATISHIFDVVAEIMDNNVFSFAGIKEDSDKQLYLGVKLSNHSVVPSDLLGQGAQSLIQIVARFLLGYGEYYDFPEELEDKPAILIIDDIDINLHPDWQRRIIPVLMRNFPNVQLFCSVTSPLILSKLAPGQVHFLDGTDNV